MFFQRQTKRKFNIVEYCENNLRNIIFSITLYDNNLHLLLLLNVILFSKNMVHLLTTYLLNLFLLLFLKERELFKSPKV